MTTNQSKTATPGKIFLALSQNEGKKTKSKKIETCMQSKYCQAVPRWIPDFRHYKASTQDMNFTFERSLTKDYTTIYNTLFAIISIEVIKDFYRDQTLLWTTLQPWLFGLGILTLVLAFIRVYKKQGKNAH